ncbi:hypothetical protein AL037_03940, partial [Salipiger aestuarii]
MSFMQGDLLRRVTDHAPLIAQVRIADRPDRGAPDTGAPNCPWLPRASLAAWGGASPWCDAHRGSLP